MATDPESELDRTERLFLEELLNRDAGVEQYLATRYRKAAQYLEPLYLEAYDELQTLKGRGIPDDQLAGYIFKEQRYAQLLSEAADLTDKLAKDYSVQLMASTQDAAQLARQSFLSQMTAALGPDAALAAGFGSFPEDQFTRMVGRLDFGSPILESVRQYGREAPNLVTNELLAGVANGESPLLVASRISSALGASYGRMVVLTRTHMLQTYRASTLATYRRHARYLDGWRWSSALDIRTCPICWAMHGQVFPLSEPMATHPCCRCSMRPVVRNWKDINPRLPDTRRYQRPEVLGTSRFDQLTRAQQRQILGPVGAEAYRRKLFQLPDLVRETYSPTWGPGRAQRSLRSVLGPDGYRKAAAAIRRKPATPRLAPARPAKVPVIPAAGRKPRAPRKAQPAPQPAAPPAGWKPSMSSQEANAWAMQGDLTRPLYHVTSAEGAQGIRREGFDLSRGQWGRVWGNGAYMSDTAASEAMYSSAFSQPTKLSLRVYSRKTLRVDISNVPEGSWGHHSVLDQLPDGNMKYNFRYAAIQNRNAAFTKSLPDAPAYSYPLTEAQVKPMREWREQREAAIAEAVRDGRYVRDPSAEAFTQTLRDDFGYDALDLVDEPHRASVGGSQVIVFDPQRVTVVNDE